MEENLQKSYSIGVAAEQCFECGVGGTSPLFKSTGQSQSRSFVLLRHAVGLWDMFAMEKEDH